MRSVAYRHSRGADLNCSSIQSFGIRRPVYQPRKTTPELLASEIIAPPFVEIDGDLLLRGYATVTRGGADEVARIRATAVSDLCATGYKNFTPSLVTELAAAARMPLN